MTQRPPLTPTQRGILGILAAAVILVGATLAVLTLVGGGDDDDVAVTTTLPPTTSTTATTTTAPTTTTTAATTTTVQETTTTTVAETTTTTEPVEEFTIRPDGIDRIFFGADAAGTIDAFTERLGRPDDDTGWVDQFEEYDGLCVGTLVRFVTWGALRMFFTDGPSAWAPAGVEHFASYTILGPSEEAEYETSNGIAIGSSVAEVERAYGDRATTYDHPIHDEVFEHDPPGDGYLYGTLTGLDDDDTVTAITGGFSCGE